MFNLVKWKKQSRKWRMTNEGYEKKGSKGNGKNVRNVMARNSI
jgi:hypothetical protein